MALRDEVERFRRWADDQVGHSGEWEADYPNWETIYDAVRVTLSQDVLSTSDVDVMLYVLARDNECEVVLDELVTRPKHLLLLATACKSDTADVDARWQLAVGLGKLQDATAISLLRRFMDDPDEYVRRRALLACASRDLVFAEQRAFNVLTAPEEYTRLAALSVLKDVRSGRLPAAIELLRNDPSSHVRKKVAEIEAAEGPND
jgi:HEAT repeat protein